MRVANLCCIVLAAIAAEMLSFHAYAANWLQFGYDTAHSGYNRAENGYSTDTGNTLLFNYPIGKAADSAPVYLGNVNTTGGVKNLLFVNTKDGTLMALDADASTLSVIWSAKPTLPAGSGTLTESAPAISPDHQFVYSYSLDGKVHKYQVSDGTEINSGGWPETSSVKPNVEKGSAALSIATADNGNTYLYAVTDGYIGDANDYQGHVTSIDLTSGAQNVFNTLCSNMSIHFVNLGTAGTDDCGSRRNGIWGRSGAVYDAATDRLFLTSGNGPYDANTGGYDWGDSVLALNPDGTGSGGGMPVDSYTPSTYSNLEAKDADLGSVSLALLPAPPGTASAYLHLGLQTGKDGCIRLINLADMSGAGAPGNVGGEIQAINAPGGSNCSTGNLGPQIKPQPAVWVNPANQSTWVYVAFSSVIAAYELTLDNSGAPSLVLQWTGSAGTSPVIANGTVYYLASGHSGAYLAALDAVTGSSVNSSWSNSRLGSIHWQSPILVNGRLYALDSTSQLWAFQLDGIFRNGFN